MPRNTAAFRNLYETAQAQGGFFTARQAREAGYQDSVHLYQVRSDNWAREARGVYPARFAHATATRGSARQHSRTTTDRQDSEAGT